MKPGERQEERRRSVPGKNVGFMSKAWKHKLTAKQKKIWSTLIAVRSPFFVLSLDKIDFFIKWQLLLSRLSSENFFVNAWRKGRERESSLTQPVNWITENKSKSWRNEKAKSCEAKSLGKTLQGKQKLNLKAKLRGLSSVVWKIKSRLK